MNDIASARPLRTRWEAEEMRKDIIESAAAVVLTQAVGAALVVDATLRWVTKNLPGLVQTLELLSSLRIIWVLVGVALERLLRIGFLQAALVDRRVHAQEVVESRVNDHVNMSGHMSDFDRRRLKLICNGKFPRDL
jgi:hypothetical protein